MAKITQVSALSHKNLRDVLDSMYTDIAEIRSVVLDVVDQVNQMRAALYTDYNDVGQSDVSAPATLTTTQE